MEKLTIPVHDFGYSILIGITESDGSTPVNLAGYVVTLKAWSPYAPDTLIASGTCAIYNEAGGSVTFTIGSATFSTSNMYHSELELTKAGERASTESYELAVPESG